MNADWGNPRAGAVETARTRAAFRAVGLDEISGRGLRGRRWEDAEEVRGREEQQPGRLRRSDREGERKPEGVVSGSPEKHFEEGAVSCVQPTEME